MKFVDLIIIILLIALISLLIYFSFIKNGGNPCHNCPYSKGCNKKNCTTDKDGNKER